MTEFDQKRLGTNYLFDIPKVQIWIQVLHKYVVSIFGDNMIWAIIGGGNGCGSGGFEYILLDRGEHEDKVT